MQQLWLKQVILKCVIPPQRENVKDYYRLLEDTNYILVYDIWSEVLIKEVLFNYFSLIKERKWSFIRQWEGPEKKQPCLHFDLKFLVSSTRLDF